MKIALSNPSIAPHVKQNVMAYYEADLLQYFYCAFFYHPDNKLLSFLAQRKGFKNELERRSFAELPIVYFKSRPIPELIRSLSARKLSHDITDIVWEWAELGFDSWVSKQIEKDLPDVVHTYEHAALATLKCAKSRGLFTVYEQLSQHHAFFTPIVEEQLKLYPQLKSGVSDLLINKKAVIRNNRRDEEIAIADLILCNSSFTKYTLIKAGIDEGRIEIIPLAFPKTIAKITEKDIHRPIRFLYAGNQSIRKGTHLLFEAWRKCSFEENEAELWLVGATNPELLLGKSFPSNVIIKENIPHVELMKLYREIDVFVLPTLADGFGMVVTEAMSQGVPAIATEHSCGPDIIDHNLNGWVIPAGNIEALVETLKWVIENKNKLPEFSSEALKKASSWQWEDYRKALIKLITEAQNNHQQKQ
jgi:glycosyltransferase involved in cell wall biosynthesis